MRIFIEGSYWLTQGRFLIKCLFAMHLMLWCLASNAPAEVIGSKRIILVGASTVAPHTGWGGAFCASKVDQLLACLNLARGGRSTRTYRMEGWWGLVLSELSVTGYEGTYILIEMGHNDKSERPEVGTKLATEFPQNLRGFIDEVRARGGIPLMVTPLSTRHFKNYEVVNTLEPWAQKIREVAQAAATPIVELNAASAAFFQQIGPEKVMAFSNIAPTENERAAAAAGTTLKPRLPSGTPITPETPEDDPRRSYTQDYLHINAKGAEEIASILARQLAIAVPELRPYLILR